MTSTAVPPGPEGHGIYGNYEAFDTDRLGFFLACRRYGPVVRFSDSTYLLYDDRLCVEVLKSSAFGTFQTFFEDEQTDEGEALWKDARSAIVSYYNGDTLEELSKATHRGVTTHLHAQTGRTVDVFALMRRLVATTSCRYVLGPVGEDVPASITGVLDAMQGRSAGFLKVPLTLPTLANLRLRRRQRRAVAAVRRSIDRAETSSLIASLKASGIASTSIAAKMVGILSAGVQVPAAALAWLCLLLDEHPEWRGRLREELPRDFPHAEANRRIDAAFPATTRFVLEALRLYPPTFFTIQSALEDTTLGGYELERGMSVIVPIYALHRDEAFFPDPDRFDPERWRGVQSPFHGRSFLPFSYGPSSCLGARQALVMMISALAAIVHGARLSAAPGLDARPNAEFILMPERPLMKVSQVAQVAGEVGA